MTSTEPLLLRPFQSDDESEARWAHRELRADDFEFLLGMDTALDWADYLEQLDQQSRGVNLAPGRVRSDLLAIDVGGTLVGRVSIRHSIDTPFLSTFGGHVGYGVRPAYRRRGYATVALRHALERLGRLGIEQALVTCSEENVGSATVIERCRGVLEGVVIFEGAPKRRYWAPTR